MKSLRAVFLTDDRLRLFTRARCELPTGEVVEVAGRRVPFYDLARKLDARGYGGWCLQIYRGLVKVMAGLTVEETDKGCLRLRRYRPFPGGRSAADGQDGVSGAPSTGMAEIGLSGAIPIRLGGGVRECRLLGVEQTYRRRGGVVCL